MRFSRMSYNLLEPPGALLARVADTDNEERMIKRLFPLILIFSSGLVCAQTELKGDPEALRNFLHPSDNVITLSADAEQIAYSDKATVSLVVTTEDAQLSNAIAKNSKVRESIQKQLTAAGIKPENIKSSKFSTAPQYGWFGKKPSSYKVVNRMAVSITEESQLQSIASVADAGAEVDMSDTSFEYSRKAELQDKVREQALAKVMKQKAFYETSLGVRLVPIGFRDNGAGQAATRGAMMRERAVVAAAPSDRAASDLSVSKAEWKAAEASFDEVRYSAAVSVDFRIASPGK